MERRIVRTWTSRHDDLYEALDYYVTKLKEMDKIQQRNPHLYLEGRFHNTDIRFTLYSNGR